MNHLTWLNESWINKLKNRVRYYPSWATTHTHKRLYDVLNLQALKCFDQAHKTWWDALENDDPNTELFEKQYKQSIENCVSFITGDYS